MQIYQEKKPKDLADKSAMEAKRLEKEKKNLQQQLDKEKNSYTKMHKQLNQEIQQLKEDLEKKEIEISKYKSLANSSVNHGVGMVSSLVTSTALNLSHLPASPMSSSVNLSSYSHSSSNNHLDEMQENDSPNRLENWLSIPNKRNIKKYGWKKLYVVCYKKKLLFYHSLRDNKELQEPYMTIDLEKVYHVRAVTQTDVVRAGTKDVAKIFQILYDISAVSGPGSFNLLGIQNDKKSTNQSIMFPSGLDGSPSMNNTNMSTSTLHSNDTIVDSALGSLIRGTNGLLDETPSRLSSDTLSVGSNDSADKHKDGKLFIKGHKFIDIKYRMPTSCDACSKPLWDIFYPPPAIECLSCHMKIHLDHYTNEKNNFQPCLLNDDNISARDLLLLCSSPAEQQKWIEKIKICIPKKAPNSHSSNQSLLSHKSN